MEWKCRIYIDERGKSQFEDKYNTSVKFQAKFDAEWNYLKKQAKGNWRRPHAAKLTRTKKNEYRDFYEIRIKEFKNHWRPIGYFGPKLDEFTILVLVREKGDNFIPKAWRDIANTARLTIEKTGDNHVKYFEATSE